MEGFHSNAEQWGSSKCQNRQVSLAWDVLLEDSTDKENMVGKRGLVVFEEPLWLMQRLLWSSFWL